MNRDKAIDAHSGLDSTLAMLQQLAPPQQRLVRELISNLLRSTGVVATSAVAPAALLPRWQLAAQADGKSAWTIRNYRYTIERLLWEFPYPAAAELDAWIAASIGDGLTPGSINARISAVKSFFDFCERESLLPGNPAAHLKPLRKGQRVRKPPPAADIECLLRLPLSPRDRAMLYLFIDAGLRLEELCSSKLADFIGASLVITGKGNKQRIVPLSPSTVRALDAYVDTLHPSTVYLFPGAVPSTHISRRRVEDRLGELCADAGIKRITPHQLRHYFATHMLNDGANLKAVSQILGHSSPAVTAQVYWHVDEELNAAEHTQHSPVAGLERRIDAPPLF